MNAAHPAQPAGLDRAAAPPQSASAGRPIVGAVIVVAYLALTFLVAKASLSVQSVILVAAVFAVLAISLDLVAGMLGLYSLGQGGFFGIGAYMTTILSSRYDWDVFLLLVAVLVVTGLFGAIVGAISLRVSGLYFAITTFIVTLVLTVLETNLEITGGLQGLLGPAFPDFPDALPALGAPRDGIVGGAGDGADQLFVGGVGVKDAIVAAEPQHHDAVGDGADVLHVVADHQHAEAAIAYPLDEVEHLGRLRDTERRRGFVEEDQLGLEQQRASDGDRLPLPARQRGDNLAHARDTGGQFVEQRPGADFHPDFVEPVGARLAPEKDIGDNIEVFA